MLHDVMRPSTNLREYLRVQDAAKLLGVHPDTLRRWERAGTFPAYRHPVNRYRLYRKDDLEQFLQRIRLI
jgi:excisionase family DNA binding protein